MKKSLTLNDFFLLTHIETDECLDHCIRKIDFSNEDRNQLSGLVIKSPSTETLPSPNKNVINNILGYARALYVLKTKSIGNFNFLMN